MGLDAFNYLAGGDDDYETQQMLGVIAGYNPELAMMMGWNPFSTLWKGAKAVGRGLKKVGGAVLPGAVGNLLGLNARKQAIRRLAAQSPLAQQTPLSAVQPQLPGVPDRGGRVQPLGFENGAFTAAGPAVVTIRARPQRPLRGGRLVADFTRTGATATGLLTLVQLVVATDGQLLSGDPISFAALSPNAFGVGVNLSPAAVGNEIFATVAISALPAMTDRVDFNLTLFGLTVG
ncbi:MAG: hypothetical protein AB7O21_19560 [Gammaproteobacteria bacterium]